MKRRGESFVGFALMRAFRPVSPSTTTSARDNGDYAWIRGNFLVRVRVKAFEFRKKKKKINFYAFLSSKILRINFYEIDLYIREITIFQIFPI